MKTCKNCRWCQEVYGASESVCSHPMYGRLGDDDHGNCVGYESWEADE
jgi:hypothetical protein